MITFTVWLEGKKKLPVDSGQMMFNFDQPSTQTRKVTDLQSNDPEMTLLMLWDTLVGKFGSPGVYIGNEETKRAYGPFTDHKAARSFLYFISGRNSIGAEDATGAKVKYSPWLILGWYENDVEINDLLERYKQGSQRDFKIHQKHSHHNLDFIRSYWFDDEEAKARNMARLSGRSEYEWPPSP